MMIRNVPHWTNPCLVSRYMSCVLLESVTNVQIGIQDRAYAEELRRLLMADGKHQVHVLERPAPAMDGVIVVDEETAKLVTLSDRYIVFARTAGFQANKLFDAGVRHVIHSEYTPNLGLLVVLAAERQLNHRSLDDQPSQGGASSTVMHDQPETQGWSMLDEMDKSFLRALRIRVR